MKVKNWFQDETVFFLGKTKTEIDKDTDRQKMTMTKTKTKTRQLNELPS